MLSDQFIIEQKNSLQELGQELHKEAEYAKIIFDLNNPENEIEWYRSVRSTCIYGTFLIQILIDELDKYKSFSEEQIRFYIGKIAIQSFLDVINIYEKSINKLVNSNEHLSKMIQIRINKKVQILEKSWKTEVNRKSRDLKDSLVKSIKRKSFEMKFIRDTLKKNEVIDDLDYDILEFSWDIRNSMHNNFVAIKDIEFSAPGTSLNYSFSFKKGEELYHPTDLKSFYQMSRQIIFIQFKILQHFNKKEEIL